MSARRTTIEACAPTSSGGGWTRCTSTTITASSTPTRSSTCGPRPVTRIARSSASSPPASPSAPSSRSSAASRPCSARSVPVPPRGSMLSTPAPSRGGSGRFATAGPRAATWPACSSSRARCARSAGRSRLSSPAACWRRTPTSAGPSPPSRPARSPSTIAACTGARACPTTPACATSSRPRSRAAPASASTSSCGGWCGGTGSTSACGAPRDRLSWAMAMDVTRRLRRLDPDDPVKYDFALHRMGLWKREEEIRSLRR
jgi:Protein of unknown function (DUF2400)